ncbi:hypothetical protein L7F22_010573 [Adiantum nelumboides]|nr:hypothetical protein [Adiantum nelumboides]
MQPPALLLLWATNVLTFLRAALRRVLDTCYGATPGTLNGQHFEAIPALSQQPPHKAQPQLQDSSYHHLKPGSLALAELLHASTTHPACPTLGAELSEGAATYAQAHLSNHPALSVKSIQARFAPADDANPAPDHDQPAPHAEIADKTSFFPATLSCPTALDKNPAADPSAHGDVTIIEAFLASLDAAEPAGDVQPRPFVASPDRKSQTIGQS